MHILFVTPSYKPAFVYGGPTVSVSELAEALVRIGHSVTVYTTTANGKEELEVPVGKAQDINGVTVFYFKRITGDHTHVSPALWSKLWRTARSFDIVNLQSWWNLLILGAAWICSRRKAPFVVSPRGMLSSYSFQALHSLPKKLVHRLAGNRLLKKAYLHATTPLEWEDCTQVHPGWKGFVLPNLVRLPEAATACERADGKGRIILGFLSRIDPKKGLELLFRALAGISFPYRLRIAGTGEEAYIRSLRSLAAELGLTENIEWCGWMGGAEKFRFLQSIDLFVLTSYNENFANAVTESLAVGTPVLVSDQVGLADYVREKGLGWVCETSPLSIRKALTRVHGERDELTRIREAAPLMIQNDYNKERLAGRYHAAYAALLGRSA